MTNRMKRLEQEEKEGEELHRKLYGGETATAVAEPEPAPETPAPAEAEAEPKPGETTVPPASSGEEPAPVPASAPAAPSLQEQFDKLAHQHRVLQGKYNAEVPRLHQLLKEAQAENARRAEAAGGGPKTGEKVEAVGAIEQEIKENYGEEYLTRFRSLVDARLGVLLEERMAKIDRTINSVSEAVQKTEGERYVERLTALAPYWSEYVNDPRFSSYLSEVDPFSGRSLYDMATEAMQSLDAPRVAEFYKAFHKKIAGAPAPAPPPNPKAAAAEPRPRTAGAPTGEPARDNEGWVTTAEMDEFTRKAQTGYYRTRPEEYSRDEARINKAIASRKIRP